MTKFILAFILCCGMTAAYSQSETEMTPRAPDEVLKGFIKLYGDASKATWSVTDDTYAASFKLINMPATAWFDSTGHRVNLVVEILEKQLPAIALSYIDRNYPKVKITKAQKWTDDNKVNTFQAELKTKTETKNLLFTSRGDLVKELD